MLMDLWFAVVQLYGLCGINCGQLAELDRDQLLGFWLGVGFGDYMRFWLAYVHCKVYMTPGALWFWLVAIRDSLLFLYLVKTWLYDPIVQFAHTAFN